MKKWKVSLILILILPLLILQGFTCTSTPGLEITYTVSFYSGTANYLYEEQTVKEGAKINAPLPPERDGYIFVGWYKDIDCTVKWDFFRDKVETNIILFAKWDAAVNQDPGTDTPPES